MSSFMQLLQSDVKPREFVRFCFIIIGIAFEYFIVRMQARLHGLLPAHKEQHSIRQEAPDARD